MKKEKRHTTYILIFAILSLVVSPVMYGCKEQKPSQQSKKVKNLDQQAQADRQDVNQTETTSQETVTEEGYVYQPRDRRDPFVPLIVPTQKTGKKGEERLGTLESYDIGEFALLAIAKKSDSYYALLITPDNRSFTVHKGSTIGLNKGRVEEITGSKVVLVEYSKDFRGDIRPKQITLEFLKER